jgi:ABC-type polysaccharide/polyol phosphate export permease
MKRVLAIVRMNDNLHTIEVIKNTLEFLYDVEIVTGFTYIMSMLNAVHEFIKFVQSRDTFVCGFVGAVKMCCANLCTFYHDLKMKKNAK